MVTSDWDCFGRHAYEVKARNDMKMPKGYPEELEKALAKPYEDLQFYTFLTKQELHRRRLTKHKPIHNIYENT